jgi:hypothetical protein
MINNFERRGMRQWLRKEIDAACRSAWHFPIVISAEIERERALLSHPLLERGDQGTSHALPAVGSAHDEGVQFPGVAVLRESTDPTQQPGVQARRQANPVGLYGLGDLVSRHLERGQPVWEGLDEQGRRLFEVVAVARVEIGDDEASPISIASPTHDQARITSQIRSDRSILPSFIRSS